MIYNVLLNVFRSVESDYHFNGNFATIIAEMSSTVYKHCVECDSIFGFIECYKDYLFDKSSGVIAVFDENDNVRYFVNDEPSNWSQCEKDSDLDKEIGILCVNCAIKWKCTICLRQILQQNQHEIHICTGCKNSICIYCIDGNSDEHVCKKCNQNDNYEQNKWTFDEFTFE